MNVETTTLEDLSLEHLDGALGTTDALFDSVHAEFIAYMNERDLLTKEDEHEFEDLMDIFGRSDMTELNEYEQRIKRYIHARINDATAYGLSIVLDEILMIREQLEPLSEKAAVEATKETT